MTATEFSSAARGGRDQPIGSEFNLWHELGMRGEQIPQQAVDAGSTGVGQIAGFDPLTGLVNRRGFLVLLDVELPLAASTGLPMVVVCLDVRHLRDINRRHGTTAGDAVLREIATRLARLANSSMLTARIGGDEFAALLLDVGDDLQVEQQMHHLVADCAGVIQIGTELIAFQVTAGASRVPLHCDPDTALLSAEIALDRARGVRPR